MPEVALRRPRRMASCLQHERASPTASPRGSLPTRLCRATRRPLEHISDVGQRAAPGAGAHAPAGSGGGRTSGATGGVAAAQPVGQGIPRPRPHVAGRGQNRPAQRALLGEVRVWPASAFGHARRRRAIHGSPLPLLAGQEICPAPLPTVPNDYDRRLRALRRRLRLTQDGLARRIGAAGKAVIYQWESRKRTPSPVLWQRVLRLERPGARSTGASHADVRSTPGTQNTVGMSRWSDAARFELDLS